MKNKFSKIEKLSACFATLSEFLHSHEQQIMISEIDAHLCNDLSPLYGYRHRLNHKLLDVFDCYFPILGFARLLFGIRS